MIHPDVLKEFGNHADDIATSLVKQAVSGFVSRPSQTYQAGQQAFAEGLFAKTGPAPKPKPTITPPTPKRDPLRFFKSKVHATSPSQLGAQAGQETISRRLAHTANQSGTAAAAKGGSRIGGRFLRRAGLAGLGIAGVIGIGSMLRRRSQSSPRPSPRSSYGSYSSHFAR